ncbi:GNAT family N-acetyltransferase [Candidatus Dojkabacteria bacterium]|nr:GNAT family N-acetyltransferase [Candidatus Dojkabacteria bacterium]
MSNNIRSKIEIREPQEKDLEELNRLSKAQWDYHYDLDSIYYLPGPGGRVIDFGKEYMGKTDLFPLIAVTDDKPIGFIIFMKGEEKHGDTKIQEFIEVYELHVSEDYRGHGVGERLMKSAEERAKEMGYEWVKLYCSSYNKGALGFYEEIGYIERQRLLFKRLNSSTN